MDLGLSIYDLAPMLECELRQLYGDREYELLEKSMILLLAERTRTEGAQFFSMLTFIGGSEDNAAQAFGLIWLVKKQFRGEALRNLVESARTKPAADFLRLARWSVRDRLQRAQVIDGVGTLYELRDAITDQTSLYNLEAGLLIQRGLQQPFEVIGIPSGGYHAARDMDQVLRIVLPRWAKHVGWILISYRLAFEGSQQ